jgi:hypothetical protein
MVRELKSSEDFKLIFGQAVEPEPEFGGLDASVPGLPGSGPFETPPPTPSGATSTPPPIPRAAAKSQPLHAAPSEANGDDAPNPRRAAKRRPAGPARAPAPANDDRPALGGLIHSLGQKPSTAPYRYALIGSAVWIALGVAAFWAVMSGDYAKGLSLTDVVAKPATFLMLAATLVPAAVIMFLAMLATRAEELRLRSAAMTEVALRLSEPDRNAEQSVASLGQAVRRQVSFMNDAVSRALGRAGELEALVHNEVSALERSYEDNERKIRGLISELAGEREALVTTSDRVAGSLKTLGTDIPQLIDTLSNQQIRLAEIIQGAGDNLSSLETAVGNSATRLETTLGERTGQLQGVLETYTDALGTALGSRTEHMENMLGAYTGALADALTGRAETMRGIFVEYTRALDTTIGHQAQVIDQQIIDRTRAIETVFADRLRLFDDSIIRSTAAIDSAVSERSASLTNALELHAKSFNETVARQSIDLDESLVRGISSVRRSSENITRQSLKAIEGLASQSDLLRNVSENLLGQINTVTNRFENQGQAIMKAANSLESVNYKIDMTLQNRHAELSDTLDRMTGKADDFGRFVTGYSSSIEGSMTDAEQRARQTAEQLKIGTDATRRTALADLDQLRSETDNESRKALDDLRQRAQTVSNAVSQQLTDLNSRFEQTSSDVRHKAALAAAELTAEQSRLKAEIERLPGATRESTDQMRVALNDQLKALEHLSTLTARTVQARDVTLPLASKPQTPVAPSGPRAAELKTLLQAAAPRPGPKDGDQRTWSFGDLLARASQEQEQDGESTPPPPQPVASTVVTPGALNVAILARAIDPTTAASVWARLRAGQRGVLVRSMYSAEGRHTLDDIARRYPTDGQVRDSVDRFIGEFDSVRADVERRDPTGRMLEQHLNSDSGRVFLMLAHASGRLA